MAFTRAQIAGGAWYRVSDGLPESDIFCLATRPLTPSTLYAGVGLLTGGVFKSIGLDGGKLERRS